MNKKNLESLRHIANRIPEQCPCDIANALCPICEEWKFVFLNGFLIFMEDEEPTVIIPLVNIYGTLRTRSMLYILCKNRVLHRFDRQTRQHWVNFLDNTDEDFFLSFLN